MSPGRHRGGSLSLRQNTDYHLLRHHYNHQPHDEDHDDGDDDRLTKSQKKTQ